MRLLLGMILAALAAVTLSAAPGDARQAAPPATDLCAGGPIAAAALADGVRAPCSLTGRTVTLGGASVLVPPPGISVGAEGYGDGRPGLVVSNLGGVVTATSGDAQAAAAGPGGDGAARAAVGACRATAYTLENGRHPWGTAVRWRLRASSVPARLGVGATRTQLVRAMRNWTTNHNSCGIPGRPHLRSRYGGATTVGSGMRASASTVRCGRYNRTDTVEFGRLPGRLLGWTCYWWGSNKKMLAFDTRITSRTNVVIDPGRSCRRSYDLQSVATHEFGHAIGLGHVDNPHLTMHHFAPYCSTAPRTLGRGDVRGLRALYGL